ncbi:MAG: acyl-CoA thioesterase II [Mycobacterium sp.]
MHGSVARPLAEIVNLLDIAAVDEGVFVAQHTAVAAETGHVFGGLVAAQATVAACRTVDPARPIHSLHAYFLRPGDPAHAIELRVELTRDGRSFSHRRVSAIQDGRAIMEMACSFATPEPGLRHQVSMPEVPEPEHLKSDWMLLESMPDVVPSLTRPAPFDVRSVGDHSRIGRDRGEVTDRSLMWMRADGEVGDDPVLHTALFVYASDMTVLDPVTRPNARSMAAGDVLPTTIDHAVWFHRWTRADQWWLCDVDSPWAGDGRGYARGRVFDRSGVLVAEIAQEGLIRLPNTGSNGRKTWS